MWRYGSDRGGFVSTLDEQALVDDFKATHELIAEEAKQGWGFWVGLALFGGLIWLLADNSNNLLKVLTIAVGVVFYHSYKAHLELSRRTMLTNRMLLALARRHATRPIEE